MNQSKQQPKEKDTGQKTGELADVVFSLRLEGDMHDRLRKLAFDRRQPMRDFIVQGIEMVLTAEKH